MANVSLLPPAPGAGTGVWTPVFAPPPSSSGVWTPTFAPSPYSVSAYQSGYSFTGGGPNAYQTPGLPAEGTELSNYPATRFRGIYGEEFYESANPIQSLLNNRQAALAAIAIFGLLLLKGK